MNYKGMVVGNKSYWCRGENCDGVVRALRVGREYGRKRREEDE